MGERRAPALDQVLRNRVYASLYWKRELFAATTETVLQQAARLRYVGSTYGPFAKPTRFLCLLLKLLHISPEPDTVFAFLSSKRLKYLVVLALFYVRFTASPRQVYLTLEQFLADYRKIVARDAQGRFALLHIDEIAHLLLRQERVFGVQLPRLPGRRQLQLEGALGPRVSALEEERERAL